MFVPKELENLSDIFKRHKKNLYVVGGYVRASIMGLGTEEDIDLASNAKPAEIMHILSGTQFKTKLMSERTGVVEIVAGNCRFEHATFRTEQYAISGEHMPADVEFVDSLELDAKRRDFTCNAIYYDIDGCQLVDPLNGIQDIKNKIVRSCIEPNHLFKNDAERILRMVRFSCCCGFNIDQKTLKGAKDNTFRLKFLSNARKRKEINAILLSDIKYPMLNLQFAHIQGVQLLFEIGALQYLFPNLNLALEENNKMQNGLTAIQYLNMLLHFSKPNTRLACLLALCGTDGYSKNGKVTRGFSIESAQEAEYELSNLEYSNETKKVVAACIKNFELFSKDKLTLGRARQVALFTTSELDELEDFAITAKSAYNAKVATNSRSLANLRLAIKQKQNRLFATSINQIKITNEQIKALKNLDAKELNEIKTKLLLIGAKKGRILSNKENLKLAKKLV